MTLYLIMYVLIGFLVAEEVRFERRETVQQFWRGHVFSNLVMIWIWPVPVFAAVATFVVEWVDRK